MMLAKFEELLKQSMGLDVASVGSSTVARAVQVRASACGLDDVRTYWQFVSASPKELQALTEAVVVPETWFFRDRAAFAAMARMTLNEWLPSNPEGVLRLLSLPCSSGEEPYSIAMALLDAGFPSKRYRIDANRHKCAGSDARGAGNLYQEFVSWLGSWIPRPLFRNNPAWP